MTSQANKSAAASTRDGRFTSTHWSLVLMAGKSASPQAQAAFEELCRAYRAPLRAFIRWEGYPPADADDLVQEFFVRLVQNREKALKDVHPFHQQNR